MAADIETALLRHIDAHNGCDDSGEFAASLGFDHLAVVGTIKSLQSSEMIASKEIDHFKWCLTEEAAAYVAQGSPEAQVFNSIPAEGLPMAELKAKFPGEVGDVGLKQAMQAKWVATDKSSGELKVVRKVEAIEDRTQQLLQAVAAGKEVNKAEAEAAKKRKLLKPEQWKTYQLVKGPKFALERVKLATELTQDMLTTGSWRTQQFKACNLNALGQPPDGGHLHPLLKVRTQFRKIFTQMGFEEMPTNNYVESSFWNFDALFQPQQHPARDAHDTFFLTHPATTPAATVHADYLQRVKDAHQEGGYGSVGYGYSWKRAEAEKNLLRTHTTAVSTRMLYQLAQGGFRPAKYFSIDRVFRNEAIDRTHLAEFHQVEGLVCDRGLTLGHLIGVLHEFFTRLGLPKLRFKPAYNPYTEPSMEIFSYSEGLKKWMEVGNSGMFRPEMLRPMGLPEDVNVIAWGLSLERPTMILYGIDNIRDLFGHRVNLSLIKRNPICRLGL
ncbi:tRNA synthetases class II core domain (F)-domain-containing protein [Haematococcus lacustris]